MNINKRHSKLKSWSNKTRNASYTDRCRALKTETTKTGIMKKRILNILFWSIISAAFIGPGTIATAATAGATFGYSLLWALSFSTFACLVLQEAAARLSIVSGNSLGRAIAKTYGLKKGGWIIFVLVSGAIIIGSAAYETGNLLGATQGIIVLKNGNPGILVLIIGILAFATLLFPGKQLLARILGFLVLFMGVVFLFTAFISGVNAGSVLKGIAIPSFPVGSSLLILGLVGTTVVPYNLFLGSGLADKTQKVSEMRFGISIAVILGGVISMAVLITGTAVSGVFSFVALGKALNSRLGVWGVRLFGFGLFAAGFSSAVTAPLAAALTASDLFGRQNPDKWLNNGLFFKLTWGFVLVTGLFFGSIGLKPVHAIIAAQALNGLILPFVSIFLWFAINNNQLMGKNHLNSTTGNFLFGFVVWIVMLLGIHNVVVSLSKIFYYEQFHGRIYFLVLLFLTFFITLFLFFKLKKIRST